MLDARQLVAGFSILLIMGCGGGGGGDAATESGFLDVFRGTLFLTDTNCSFDSRDTLENRYIFNSDAAQTIVQEFSDIQRTFTGAPLTGEEQVLTVTREEVENCIFSNGAPSDETFTIFRSIMFTMQPTGDLDVVRTQRFSGCDDPDCSRTWAGIVERD